VGVRVVQTKFTSQGFSVPSSCSVPDSLSCVFPAGTGWTTFSNTHTNALPAFNIAYDMNADVVLRGALSTTVAYAPYNQLAPYFEANDTVLTAAAGNPNLSPYKSNNLDGSIEWYFAPQSAVAASLFYKDVSNYIVQQATVQNVVNGSHTQPGFKLPPSCNPTTFVCPYSVTEPVDGGSAKVKGFAVSYQQPYAYGFGLKANYTYSDATTSGGGDMPYNSKGSYSIGPYWEQGPWTATLAYNWRGKYLAGGYVAGAPSTYVDSYTELDGSLAYAINDHWAINFDALNLNNPTYLQYNGNPEEFANEYKLGRQFLLTARFKF
jgi:iron complex outermembrane receptor protein